jgi:NhaA family Na+:H+ antiporter
MSRKTTILEVIRELRQRDSASGELMLLALLVAMIWINSPLSSLYEALLGTPVEIRVGKLTIFKPLLLWINDGLMALFFLLVGLELKREILKGELSSAQQLALPAFAAVGGMAIPAMIYVVFNWNNVVALNGWAIPCATDIAFTLGILSVLGNRVPYSLKIFLVSLAVIDDLAAIIIIAIFYTGDLYVTSLFIGCAGLLILFLMNISGVTKITPYILIGIGLWISLLESGVHATLAGFAVGLSIPMRLQSESQDSPLRQLEEDLRLPVTLGILPLFAFANAGVSLEGVSLTSLLEPVPLGIAIGLFFGKQMGVLAFSWIAVQLRLARLPDRVGWLEVYGTAVLCGIGFTMSLFIGSLAFEHGGPDYKVDNRLGILVGSALSAITGYLILRRALSRRQDNHTKTDDTEYSHRDGS